MAKENKNISDINDQVAHQPKYISETVKKSVLTAKASFEFDKLARSRDYFLPMTYEEDLETVELYFDVGGVKGVNELKKEEKARQYQFLINFKELEAAFQEFNLELTTENLYYDDNYFPYVKFRDVLSSDSSSDQVDFVDVYKGFIGGILGQKYTVEKIQDSGLDILKSESAFQEFYQAKSSDELDEILKKRKDTYEVSQEETTVVVPKKGFQIKSILAVVSPIVLVIVLGGFIYNHSFVVPFQGRIILANEAYNERDFVAVIDIMESIDTDDMSANSKYILAVSYARSESLRQDEIRDIIGRLSPQSNERELEFWIYIGRLNHSRAQELAGALSDDQLRMYAYMVELNQLESDTTTVTENRQGRIDQLRFSISSLGGRFMNIDLDGEDLDGNVEENDAEDEAEDTQTNE